MKTLVTWHRNIRWNEDLYPTRNYSSYEGDFAGMLSLSAQQRQESGAAHELGHAIAHLAQDADAHLARVDLYSETTDIRLDTGVTRAAGGYTLAHYERGDEHALWCVLVACAAGERAQDRWLREAGLWTPTRAVAIEVLARSDRDSALHREPRLGFGDAEIDYGLLHDEADAIIDRHWEGLRTAVPVLMTSGRMTGDELAAYVGLPNPEPPADVTGFAR